MFVLAFSESEKSPLAPQRGEPKAEFFRKADLRFFLCTSVFVAFPLSKKGDEGGFFKVLVSTSMMATVG
jgi:hypothetical protein